MWPFSKKKERPIQPAVLEARAAQERAQEVIVTVQTRETEVNQIVGNLQRRGSKNNFGRALELAMENKRYV